MLALTEVVREARVVMVLRGIREERELLEGRESSMLTVTCSALSSVAVMVSLELLGVYRLTSCRSQTERMPGVTPVESEVPLSHLRL